AATSLDPGYAAAYAELALAEYFLADTYLPGDQVRYQAGCDRAVAAAEKAVALAPGLARGYAVRGGVGSACRAEFAGARADSDKAVSLSPGDAEVLHLSACLIAFLGELPDAIAREEKAFELDPLSAEIVMRLAFYLTANQQLVQARALYEKALAI